MMNFSLSAFIQTLVLIDQEIANATLRLKQPPDEATWVADKERIKNNFPSIAKACRDIHLMRSEERVSRIAGMLNVGPESYAEILKEFTTLREAIDDDITYERFYHYPNQKGLLLLRVPGDWAPTIKSFPKAYPEINDAVDCYAMGHPTASVFHLMRVAEHGLRALARERQVVFPRKPVEWATWQDLLNAIETSTKKQWAHASAGPAKDAALAFYSGAMAHFHGFKDEYRNVVMHDRKRYDEHQALRAINHVKDFMNGNRPGNTPCKSSASGYRRLISSINSPVSDATSIA